MIKCTINNKVVKVKEGTTIIEAFYQMKEDIAHYCYHPGLSVAGVCRLCMVEVEGDPKLQIACNTVIQDGMVITNKSKLVQDTVRWGLEFHLINHPLDCPICDQAGECILQDQYMKFGQYNPKMGMNKVKKKKVVDLGSKIVLDTERCILCARCTRFTDEITKTKELGIFNRGDRSEIGIFKNRPLENDYALNTVDICPVGALTSKEFRFKQRVWYLKSSPSVCTGCSTGCNVNIYHNEEGVWRTLPRYNKDINQHWMCDRGRETIFHINKKGRLIRAERTDSTNKQSMKTKLALEKMNSDLKQVKDLNQVALVLTGQYTTEEYRSFISYFSTNFNSNNIFHWKNSPEDFDSFDGFLIRGDKNPNTAGLLKVGKELKISLQPLEKLNNKNMSAVIVCGPENHKVYPDIEKHIQQFLKFSLCLWISPRSHALLNNPPNTVWAIPAKTYFEKSGTFINYQNKEQKIKSIGSVVKESLSLDEIVRVWTDTNYKINIPHSIDKDLKTNFFLDRKEV